MPSKAPLLVLRASEGEDTTPPSELTSITVPLDGSTLAEEGLSHVIDLARK